MTDQPETRPCGRTKDHPAHRFMTGREVLQCPGSPAGSDGPVEPDNPAATALAQHIADHPVSTVQAAFRLLGMRIDFELSELEP